MKKLATIDNIGDLVLHTDIVFGKAVYSLATTACIGVLVPLIHTVGFFVAEVWYRSSYRSLT